MSERKSINKYYPPDYNPLEAERAARKLSKKLKNTNKDITTIRLMTPFSMRCTKCETFIPKSRKFNGKKELLNERYLNNIKIFRLSIRCPLCSQSISFRTDPKSADYVMENGAIRNFVKKTDVIGDDRTESIDETLERLAHEQEHDEREKERLLNRDITNIDDGNKRRGNTGEDKMAALEERLIKIQKEQESAEEIERLRKQNYDRIKNADETFARITNAREKQTESSEPIEDDSDVERLAEEAFKRNADEKINDNKPVSSTSTGPINLTKPEQLDVNRLIVKRKKKKKTKLKLGSGSLMN
ncbi:similar to Saccharomyces cerevisiae YKL095W YJU2 Essential protein required for pre-mRNA splicing [Maudiozyma saulgeensis]|uniref:Splicing factor YJU2 n=1 Tax=Maudiozyma saulgeensis TaxID=1789683 RepID=A0A1X7R039_9SACH|nr:similar to Saccharomyces cerevisiae YKL095W YJU2 Essential protein required for pre-mRNA splicing [Kazachstania saulgeensis]